MYYLRAFQFHFQYVRAVSAANSTKSSILSIRALSSTLKRHSFYFTQTVQVNPDIRHGRPLWYNPSP